MTNFVSLVNATFSPASDPADPASRRYAHSAAPDGAGTIGEDQYWPQPQTLTPDEVKAALNPLQHVPIVGTFYRLIAHEPLPAPIRVASSMLTGMVFGGPVGAVGTAVLCLAEELIRIGPDESGPAVPPGMRVTGSEAGVEPVMPAGSTAGASPVMLASEWSATRILEMGIA